MTTTPRPSRSRKARTLLASVPGRRAALAVALVLTPLIAAAAPRKKSEPKPLHQRSFTEILAQYTFVGDFDEKPAERNVSDEIFWKYPLPLPKVDFPIDTSFDPQIELPATKGEGRAVDHLNRGRALFLQGNILEARNTWLTGRARFGKEYPFHRRNDYMIAQAFLKLGHQMMASTGLPYEDKEVRPTFANAATFFAWAYLNKADQPDALVDQMMPKGLYNLAAIYWKYDRFAGAFGAADRGLNFLRGTGRKEFRAQLNRIQAESFIKNRSYLEAVQALDRTIRQDPAPEQAGPSFTRVGDIYFDLNNYELAEDAYALGARVDEELRRINPAQLVLRGEALFWLGRFSEAQKMLHFALQGSSFRKVVSPLPESYAPWAALRLADSYLARRELDKAKLEYFKVGHTYSGTLAARIAHVREACLELPFYSGQNIKHARELLEEAKVTAAGEGIEPFPAPGVELAWACQVGSYTDRERTPEMLDRVKAFYAAYPDSRFLQSFVEPVREFQATHLMPLFKAGETYKAIDFFEKTRKTLFAKVPREVAEELFVAYADTARPEAAAEWWPQYAKLPDSDLKVLRQVTVASELIDKQKGKPWDERVATLAKELLKREWRIEPSALTTNYVMRTMQTKAAPKHYPWLHELAKAWAKRDGAYTCDMEYPLLSRMVDGDVGRSTFVLERIEALIDQNLPELFKHDESCALSLLELESRLLRKDSVALAGRYAKRQDWPLQGAYLHLYWTIAEHLNDDGDRASATKMWQVIRDKGAPGTPEVQFAKTRLDKSKTELEKLWD